MKPRFPLFRVVAFTMLAAGAGVAYLATREDGRAKLAQAGETIGKFTGYAGDLIAVGAEYASQMIERFQTRDDYLPVAPPYSKPSSNGNVSRSNDLITAR